MFHLRPIPIWMPIILLCCVGLLAFSTWLPISESQTFARIAALVMLMIGLADGIMLVALPRLRLSYGLPGLSWSLILCSRIILLLLFILPLAGIFHFKPTSHTPQVVISALFLWVIANLAASAVAFYGMYIEPFDLRVTKIQLPGPAFFPERPLRILQLTDLHIERITKREGEILTRIKMIKPDMIVMTGDYVNYDYAREPFAIQETRNFLSQLHAPYGVFAIPGSQFVDPPASMARLFSELDIIVLENQAHLLSIGLGKIYLIGVNIDHDHERAILSGLIQQAPPGIYSVLLYHTPDLIESAAGNGVNLYLAGHTHGGQIRFPFIGAVITLSAYGRKYASGQHTLGPTTLYTSRGLGMEGLHLPRARLLCPPEMVIIELDKHG